MRESGNGDFMSHGYPVGFRVTRGEALSLLAALNDLEVPKGDKGETGTVEKELFLRSIYNVSQMSPSAKASFFSKLQVNLIQTLTATREQMKCLGNMDKGFLIYISQNEEEIFVNVTPEPLVSCDEDIPPSSWVPRVWVNF